MAKASNMSTPVTRNELQKAVEPLATKTDLQKAIEPLATKAELQKAIEPLATKAELQKAIEPLATKVELELWGGALLARMDQMHQQLQIDLARHVNASHESMMTMLRGHDEKYADLPGRVSRLESAVFTPKPV
jgi:alpha-D-ribose 1-methylphosphonate 5-triphosphate synthase subunit PhnG